MTWDDIAKAILEMSDGEREKTVYFLEPYDEDAEIFHVELLEAEWDLSNPDGDTLIKKGEAFLQ